MKGLIQVLPLAWLTVATVAIGPASCAEVVADDAAQARDILEASGVKGGLVVHLGCGDGRLTAALRANPSYLVHGLDTDICAAREHIRTIGLYGGVSAMSLRGKRLPYADNLVNLLVAQDMSGVPMTEVMRVLCPQGVAYINGGGNWMKTVKPRPAEIDEWTHYLYAADNNAVSKDTTVGPPKRMQWVGGPEWARTHDHLASMSSAVSSGGRIFYVADEGPIRAVALPPKWILTARDAFNGITLWKRDIKLWVNHLRPFRSGPVGLPRRLVASGQRVYVTLGYGEPVSVLEASSGKTLKTLDGTAGALEMVLDEGRLYVLVGDSVYQRDVSAIERRARRSTKTKQILAFDAEGGQLLWKKRDAATTEVMPTTLCVGGGRLFFQNTEEIVCVDAKSGDDFWSAPRPSRTDGPAWSAPTLVIHGDVLLSAGNKGLDAPTVTWNPERRVRTTAKGLAGDLVAFAAADGKKLWSCDAHENFHAPIDVLAVNGSVWSGMLAYDGDPGMTSVRDLFSGEVKKTRQPDQDQFNVGFVHHRCYRNKATPRYLLLGRSGVEFIDVNTGEPVVNHWIRGTCQYGIMPANGLLYVPPHSCACYIYAKLNGFNALSAAEVRLPTEPDEKERLEKGLTYNAIDTSPLGLRPSEDWPTYRHDPARSGYTTAALPANLTPAWEQALGGRLTAPVIADGKLLVASIDTHTVHALDAKEGQQLWSFTAGARVDSPPTMYKGAAIFGCRDGWVYCLRLADGQLAWRFRAASEERFVVSYDGLESAWPVHGSVLVKGDVLYCTAGRSSYLDGGIFLYRLEPLTGKQLSVTRLDSRDPKTGFQHPRAVSGAEMPGLLSDVLSSTGDQLFMRHAAFDLECRSQGAGAPHLFCSAGFLDDSWWHRTYWQFGVTMRSGYPRWHKEGNVVPAGRILAVGPKTILGFGRTPYAGNGSHVGLGRSECRIFAAFHDPAKAPVGDGRRPPPAPTFKPKWVLAPEVEARAMVLAGKTLFVSGPQTGAGPTAVPPSEDVRDALLLARSAEDGKKLSELKLDSIPVFDGMAAAGESLYLVTRDGKVRCLR